MIDRERVQDGAAPSRPIGGRDARDRELREAARAFLDKPVTRLHTELSRYVTDAWPRDRLVDEMPPRYIGTIREFFYRAMKAHPRAPGRRQLSNIVGNEHTLGIASEVDHDDGSKGDQHVSTIHKRSQHRRAC
jgi:hypothetical protein